MAQLLSGNCRKGDLVTDVDVAVDMRRRGGTPSQYYHCSCLYRRERNPKKKYSVGSILQDTRCLPWRPREGSYLHCDPFCTNDYSRHRDRWTSIGKSYCFQLEPLDAAMLYRRRGPPAAHWHRGGTSPKLSKENCHDEPERLDAILDPIAFGLHVYPHRPLILVPSFPSSLQTFGVGDHTAIEL